MYKNTNLFLLLNIHISKVYLFTQFMLNSDYTYQVYMETFIDRTNHNFCYFLWNIRTGQIFHSFIDVKSGIFTVLKNEINTMHASYFKKKCLSNEETLKNIFYHISKFKKKCGICNSGYTVQVHLQINQSFCNDKLQCKKVLPIYIFTSRQYLDCS